MLYTILMANLSWVPISTALLIISLGLLWADLPFAALWWNSQKRPDLDAMYTKTEGMQFYVQIVTYPLLSYLDLLAVDLDRVGLAVFV